MSVSVSIVCLYIYSTSISTPYLYNDNLTVSTACLHLQGVSIYSVSIPTMCLYVYNISVSSVCQYLQHPISTSEMHLSVHAYLVYLYLYLRCIYICCHSTSILWFCVSGGPRRMHHLHPSLLPDKHMIYSLTAFKSAAPETLSDHSKKLHSISNSLPAILVFCPALTKI